MLDGIDCLVILMVSKAIDCCIVKLDAYKLVRFDQRGDCERVETYGAIWMQQIYIRDNVAKLEIENVMWTVNCMMENFNDNGDLKWMIRVRS